MRAIAVLLAGAALAAASPAVAQSGGEGQVKAGVDAWSAGDFDAAVKAWQGPADKGDADAQYNLAQAYKLGRGVPVDPSRAEALYRNAAVQGHLQAGDNLGLLLFQSGRREEALPWITASADRGDARAQYVLGIATFNGDLVAKDWVRAYALMTRASSSGVPQARDALASMDKIIPLQQRQMGVSLAGELERQAEEARAREVATADLGITAPLRTAPVPSPVDTTSLPPSNAAAFPAPAVVTAGADFANPVALGTPAPVKVKETRRVVGAAVPVDPVPAPQVAAAPPPAPPARPKAAPAGATAPAGRWKIQFGAFGNRANADALWSRLSRRPELSGRSRIDVAAGGVTRLQAGPFASEAEARQACAALASVSGQCLVVRP